MHRRSLCWFAKGSGKGQLGVQGCIVADRANHATPNQTKGDAVLRDRGIVVLPDIYTNAGGVTVSFFEWVQNLQNFKW
jgi:glutamate dehydrogenase (NAD(P)+)